MPEKREIEGWAHTSRNVWLDRHYFVKGKALPLCNATINNFYQIQTAPATTAEFQCGRCADALKRRKQKQAAEVNTR